jgi:hypothetical protein
MKTQIFWVLLLSAFLIGFSSQTFAQEMNKQDYLDKSRRQKTTGFILLGGGVTLLVVGSIIYMTNGVELVGSCIGLNCSSSAANGVGSGVAMITIGGLAALGSIPFFISSSKNINKAVHLSFRNEPTNIPKYAGNIPRSVPSITYSIPLN